MAQRRMFSPSIVESDAFLDMPISSQALYFHLGMFADDDGFVNPRRIMRMIGVSDDDLKILITKNFALPFAGGVLVITHWRMNNLVRKDWYKPTQYIDERQSLFVRGNGAYTLDSAHGKPLALIAPSEVVNESLTVRSRRLGKERLGKDNTHSALSFLKDTPKDDLKELAEKYFISPKGIKSKAYDLYLYCEETGKVYQSYRALLENAIRKDKLKLQADYPPIEQKSQEAEIQLTAEQIARNTKMRGNISSFLRKGSVSQ